jgi:hypothetical protein
MEAAMEAAEGIARDLAETSAEPRSAAADGKVRPHEAGTSGVDGRLRAGGAVRLGAHAIAAHACLAEMEQAAAADAEIVRPADLKRVALDASRRAVAAAEASAAEADAPQLAAAAAARAELEREANAIASALRARLRALWQACGLSAPGLESVLRTATTYAASEAEAELLMAKAKGGSASGGVGGGVLLATVVVGNECAQLASLLASLRRHGQRTRAAFAAVAQREQLVRHLRLSCARLVPMHALQSHRSKLDAVPGRNGAAPPMREIVRSLEVEIVSTVALLRQATVRVVEAVLAWRGGLVSQALFAVALDAGRQPTGVEMGGEADVREQCTPNYVLRMATDLDGITELSSEMPSVLHEAPSRLDRRRLWRARQAIDLELQTEQRATRQAAADGGAPMLRWRPVPTSELRRVPGQEPVCLFDVSADVAEDEPLVRDLLVQQQQLQLAANAASEAAVAQEVDARS